MNREVKGYRPSAALGLILILVALFCWENHVSADPGHFIVSHTSLTFSINGPRADEWITDDNETCIDITRKDKYGNDSTDKGNSGNGPNDPLKYRIKNIPRELEGFIYVRINNQDPIPLGDNWVTFVDNGVDYVTVEFLLDPRVVWRVGEYKVVVEHQGQKAQPIDLFINLGPFARIKSVPDHVLIEATDGPGRYQSELVEFMVEANHTGWKLDLVAGELVHDDPKVSATIQPSELLMSLEVDGELGEFVPFEEGKGWTKSVGRVITPSDCVKSGNNYIATAYFAADIDWHHLAGSYTGQVNVTLEQNCN